MIPGLNRPSFLLGLLLVLPLLYMFWNRSERQKRVVISIHIVIVSVLCLAAAQPYVPTQTQIYEEPTVTVLEDSSRSTQALRSSELVLEGVDVETVSIASGNTSDIESALKRSIEPDSAFLIDSDLQTDTNLGEVFAQYRRQNSTLGILKRETEPDMSVLIQGPRDTVPGTKNTYSVEVESTRRIPSPALELDGSQVSLDKLGNSTWEYTTEFKSTGDHTLKASVPADSVLPSNNEFHMTVDVKQKPQVLVVGDSGTLEDRLDEFYNFENVQSIPDDLSDYSTVLAKKRPERGLTDYVASGNGYVRTGEIKQSRDILPVEPKGDVEDRSTRVVLAIDISQNAAGGVTDLGNSSKTIGSVILARKLIGGLPETARAGILMYNDKGQTVSDLKPVGLRRDKLISDLRTKVPRNGTGQSYHFEGIRDASNLLNGTGNIILISDGILSGRDGGSTQRDSLTGIVPNVDNRDERYTYIPTKAENRRRSLEAARRINARIISLGVGNQTNKQFLKKLGLISGGAPPYAEPDESNAITERLNLSGGGGTGSNENLVVTDPDHFIADGLSPSSTTGAFDPVEAKFGSRRPISSSSGNPVLTVWRYGLGRSAAFTAGSEHLDRIVRTDPNLVSRTLSWSVGDYGRDEGVNVEDTRIPESPTATSSSETEGLKRQGPETYASDLEPRELGFHQFRGDTYAYTYNEEVQGAGYDTENLEELRSKGFNTYSVNQTGDIKEDLRQFSRRTETEKRELATPLVFAALILLLFEIAYRKLNGME